MIEPPGTSQQATVISLEEGSHRAKCAAAKDETLAVDQHHELRERVQITASNRLLIASVLVNVDDVTLRAANRLIFGSQFIFGPLSVCRHEHRRNAVQSVGVLDDRL